MLFGRCIYHVPVVIDGVIAAAAAAAAGRIAPAAKDYMLAAHVSAEPASIWLLDLIGVTPAIQAGLRLGEGTGALAAVSTCWIWRCPFTGIWIRLRRWK